MTKVYGMSDYTIFSGSRQHGISASLQPAGIYYTRKAHEGNHEKPITADSTNGARDENEKTGKFQPGKTDRHPP